MLLTVSTTRAPATDLGYLLHKHPGRVQSFPQSVGTAHVFYPDAADERCTAALLLEVDPIGLVRGRKGPSGDGFALGQYVNDRPYAASSMLAMALKDVFRTALTGRCDARPELAAAPMPLEIHVPAVPCRGGADLLRRLFEPLGWRVEAAGIPLDPAIPDWGDSRYLDMRLTGVVRLADALNHLYVLLPVLDDAKHYWVSNDEVDKLIRAGAGWLASHPEKDLISRRYLAHRRELTQSALARLAEVDDTDRRGARQRPRRRGRRWIPRTGRSRWRSSAAAPCSRRSGPAAHDGSATSAAARACWWPICWPSGHRAESSRSTCRRGPCRSPARSCAWSRCPSSSVRGWRSSSPR